MSFCLFHSVKTILPDLPPIIALCLIKFELWAGCVKTWWSMERRTFSRCLPRRKPVNQLWDDELLFPPSGKHSRGFWSFPVPARVSRCSQPINHTNRVKRNTWHEYVFYNLCIKFFQFMDLLEPHQAIKNPDMDYQG